MKYTYIEIVWYENFRNKNSLYMGEQYMITEFELAKSKYALLTLRIYELRGNGSYSNLVILLGTELLPYCVKWPVAGYIYDMVNLLDELGDSKHFLTLV